MKAKGDIVSRLLGSGKTTLMKKLTYNEFEQKNYVHNYFTNVKHSHTISKRLLYSKKGINELKIYKLTRKNNLGMIFKVSI